MIGGIRAQWWHGLGLWLLLSAAPVPASGEPFTSMQLWDPELFEISCGGNDGPYRPVPRDTSCISDDVRVDFESYSQFALNYLQGHQFLHPKRLGPVVLGFEQDVLDPTNPYDAIRIFTNSDANAGRYAYVQPEPPESGGSSCDPDTKWMVFVNPALLGQAPTHVSGFIAAHELFHTIQVSDGESFKPNKHRVAECYKPPWILEAQANTAAMDFTRRVFSDTYPPAPTQKLVRHMIGLRPYNVPLNYAFPEIDAMPYATSSLWRHIGDRYHGKRFEYLEDYAKVPAPTYGDDKEDWLRWLDERLLDDPRVDMPLYLFYPGFLADFASEWVKGGAAEKFGRARWLLKGFDACATAAVSPESPYIEIEVDLYPVAGICLSVTIGGLGAADLASVKVGALTESEEIADSLHLGFAFTNDQTGFSCTRLLDRYRPAPGAAACLMEPVTGTLDSGVQSLHAVRMWHASSLEKGPGAQRKGGSGGDIENVYVLSYVPAEPWEEFQPEVSGLPPPTTVRLGIGLEWARLAVDGADVNEGPADGKRTAKRKRAVGAMGIQPLESDILHPASSGYTDMGPLHAMFGEEMTGLVTELSEMARRSSGPIWGGIAGGDDISLFNLGQVEATPAGIASETLEVTWEFSVLTQDRLAQGVTGTFEAVLMGGNRNEPQVAYWSVKDEPAALTVTKNSRGTFRASVRGRVCKVDFEAIAAAAAALATGAPECTDPIMVEGEIAKPFAYLYRPETALHSVQTEGEKLYNKYRDEKFFAGGSMGGDSNIGGGPGGRDGLGGTGAGSGSAAIVPDCDCACGLREAQPAGCQPVCAARWQACRAAEEAERASSVRDAQIRLFTRLLGERDMAPEIREMLIEDFTGQSESTRRHLIRRYHAGDG